MTAVADQFAGILGSRRGTSAELPDDVSEQTPTFTLDTPLGELELRVVGIDRVQVEGPLRINGVDYEAGGVFVLRDDNWGVENFGLRRNWTDRRPATEKARRRGTDAVLTAVQAWGAEPGREAVLIEGRRAELTRHITMKSRTVEDARRKFNDELGELEELKRELAAVPAPR